MRLVQRFAFEVKKRLIDRPDERDSNIAIEHMVSSFVSTSPPPPPQLMRPAYPGPPCPHVHIQVVYIAVYTA